MDRRPGQDHRRQRAIGPTIQDDLDVLADQCSILFDCRTVRDDTWMTLGCRREIFMPVVNQPDGPARLAGEERCMHGDDRGVLFLTSEPTAGLGLHYHRLLIGQLQCSFEGPVDVIGAL